MEGKNCTRIYWFLTRFLENVPNPQFFSYTKQSAIHCNVMTQFLCHIEIQIHFFRRHSRQHRYATRTSYNHTPYVYYILHTTREEWRFQLFIQTHWKNMMNLKMIIILRINQKRGREKETHNKNQFISFSTLWTQAEIK